MAERRMFAKTIIDSDAFLEMPATSQLLYFHLAMRADDDGFINRPKTIMRICGTRDDDMSILIAKKFIIPFETGVVVIKHWRIHNYIKPDRYKETIYQNEKALLGTKDNKSYTLNRQCLQNGSNMDTQVRLGKVSIELGKDSIDSIPPTDEVIPVKESFVAHGEYGWVKLKPSQYEKLKVDFPNTDIDIQIKLLDEYVQSNGNKNKYKDFNLVLRKSIKGGWFTKANNTYGKKTKSVPDWFDSYVESEDKRQEEMQKEQEKNAMSMEELEEIFAKKKRLREEDKERGKK